MYHHEFQQLGHELSGLDNETLAKLASLGGWRKNLLDFLRYGPSSWLNIPSVFCFLLAMLVSTLPPVGKDFRRALVAQDILDRKGAVW